MPLSAQTVTVVRPLLGLLKDLSGRSAWTFSITCRHREAAGFTE